MENKTLKAPRTIARKRRASSKRFFLVHSFGMIEPSVVGKGHKTYDSLLKAARKLYRDEEEYNSERDSLFYLLTQDRHSPEIGTFMNIELDNDDEESEKS